jgi:hypothetical protein
MDSAHILKPTTTVTYSLLNKISRFFAAAILADWVLGNAINVFIQNLNNKGVLKLGDDFKTTYMIWGDSIWLNILHILILSFTAGLFGFIFAYLIRRVSLSDKLIYTTLYVFIRFVFLGLTSLLVEIFFPKYSLNLNQLMTEAFYEITSSTFNTAFVILGYVTMFFSAIFFMRIGSQVINNPHYLTDKIKSGTLLDIKWYHYLWLFIPIGFYVQVILNLIFRVGSTIVILVKNFKWSTIFGDDNSGKGNPLDLAWGSLFWIALIAAAIIFLMDYLRKILIGNVSYNKFLQILIVIGIGFGIPFLLYWFTSFAG